MGRGVGTVWQGGENAWPTMLLRCLPARLHPVPGTLILIYPNQRDQPVKSGIVQAKLGYMVTLYIRPHNIQDQIFKRPNLQVYNLNLCLLYEIKVLVLLPSYLEFILDHQRY